MPLSSPSPAPWRVAGSSFNSRLLLGSARYPSLESLRGAITLSGAEILTVSVRRLGQSASGPGADFFAQLKNSGKHLLPNTAGCYTAEEALTTARMAREIFGTHWIKLEVIGDATTLQPDTAATLEAASVLAKEGFAVFAYTTEDLVCALRLRDAGCAAVMPWAAPIGTGLGALNLLALETLRQRLQDCALIIDAGLGLPHHAAQMMEMGFDAVLLNSAVAHSGDPAKMAIAFAQAIRAGRLAYEAQPMPAKRTASASTPISGTPFRNPA